MQDFQPEMNEKLMKKISVSKASKSESLDMLPEINFDYGKARPNRFAGRISEERVVVLLDPDVSQVFTTAESVNKVLRALVKSMPASRKRKVSI